MTTIDQLPQELLPEIFKYFHSDKLITVQHVCRAWYLPAHLSLLKEVDLCSIHDIDNFIASIDQNTNPSYLAAVEKIEIGKDDGYGVEYDFDKDSIDKLFCRFPNLKHITISSCSACFEEFNEISCQTITEKCPKLEHFEILLDEEEEHKDIYCSTMYKLRSLVTVLNLDSVGSASGFGGTTSFIGSFPRLRKVWDMANFQDYLPIFEQVSNLSTIAVKQLNYENEEGFAERYLARKPKEQQDLILKRMSKVVDVTYCGGCIFSPHSIRFIAKYFTDLKRVEISFYSVFQSWTSLHQEVLLNEMTNLVVKDHASITLLSMELEIVAECLPTIAHNLFSRLQFNRTLQISIEINKFAKDKVSLHLQWPTTKQLDIRFGKECNAYDSMRTLFNSQFNDIDRFVFYVRDRAQHTGEININTYNIALKATPSLMEATLDIPTSFTDSITTGESYQHTRMEKLVLRPSFSAKFQSLLDTYALMFPNLKYLHLFYFCGERKQDSRDFYVNLDNYTLERLILDMTPVKRIKKKKLSESDFFVVQIETLEKKERYKISKDFSSVTSVGDGDCQDCVCVHILVKRLQSLEAYMHNTATDYGEYLDVARLSNLYVKHATIYNKNQ